MYTKGHIGVTLILFSPIMFYLMMNGFGVWGVAGLITAGTLSTILDQDQNIPFLTHRGISHSIASAFAVAIFTVIILALIFSFSTMFFVPLGAIIGVPPMVVLGFFGFISFFTIITHLIADLLTPSGVPLLKPFSDKKFGLGLIYASNPVANVAFWLIGWSATILVFLFFIGTVLGI